MREGEESMGENTKGEGRGGKEGGKRGKDGRIGEEEGGVWKVAFWNVAGLKNKDKGFWGGLKEWDVVVMMETWIEGRDVEKMRGWLPGEFVWKWQEARREKKKGRAKGGMLVGVKKWLDRWEEGEREEEKEGIIEVGVRENGIVWRIVGIYVRGDLDRKLEEMREWMEKEGEEGRVIIGGDFNARIGTEGGGIRREGEEGGRKSKDKVITREGRKLIERVEEMGWEVINGGIEGDEEGEWTFVGSRGESVIDLVMVGEDNREEVERLVVEERVDSDHLPVVVWMKGGRGKRAEGRRKKDGRMGGKWSGEEKETFRERMDWGMGEGDRIGERIRGVKSEAERVMKELGEARRGKGGRGWWDEECKEMKRGARRTLREWRRGMRERQEYVDRRTEYRKRCEEKKEEERKRFEKEIQEAGTEGKVWELINRERKKWKGINKEIRKEEWDGYFRRLLGGVESRVVRGRRVEKGEERGLGREEIRRAIGRMKEGKAVGEEGIPGEVWRFGGERAEAWVAETCGMVWRGEGWPEEWNGGVVVPIVKKGVGKRVEEYRGVTIMPSLYKVYAFVLVERLVGEMERGEMLAESQAGFRKGRGTLDNIYVVNFLANRQLERRKGEMFCLFVDLRAAFDEVDREVLWNVLRERGVSEGLRERIEDIYRETWSRVRVGGEVGERFWTGRGLRQGCPLSPHLFNMMLADLEEELKEKGMGGMKVGGERVFSLTYADDVVLMAESAVELKWMIKGLERYLDRKRLKVNVGKTKVLRFKRGKGRRKKEEWKWKGEAVEEVKSYKYLGYTFVANGGQEGHVKERVRRVGGVMRQVWGIGKRRFKGDWQKRLWLFDRLVRTVMGYGAEIWGWKERKELEAVQERFIRWTLGVDWRTPGYMVREETQREKIRMWAGERAIGFERRVREGGGSEWVKRCVKEMGERAGVGGKGSWEKEREEFFEEKGAVKEMVERKWEEGGWDIEEMRVREKEKERAERWRGIEQSRFGWWYGMVKGEGMPEYLKKGWGESRWRRVARFRLGSEIGEARYWEGEDERRCRVCGGEEETWEHVWDRCGRGEEEKEGWQESMRAVLGEDGEGEWWMREVEERRGGRGDE